MRVMRVLAALLMVGGAGACVRAATLSAAGPDVAMKPPRPVLLAEATLSPDSATAIAKRRVPGRITKAELEREGGILLYSFDIRVVGESGLTEVHVDARTGAILAVEHER